MKDLLLRFCRWVLPLLGISSVVSCDGYSPVGMYGTQVAEYGTPTVEFSVKGKVVDADSNPVPNIEVKQEDYYETVRTAADGSFEIKGDITGFKMETASLTFTDTDGAENGGEFITKTVEIPMTQTDTGDGNWDNGDYSASDVQIILTKK